MRKAEKMKTLAIAAIILAGLAAPSLAGGPTVVADDPMPEAAPAPVAAHDWSGAYVGLGYGRASGGFTYSNGSSFDLESGKLKTLFAGYLMQRGNLVYGGELALSNGSGITTVGFPNESVDRVLDLKGKVGVAANRALFYGVLGVSKVDYEFATVPAQNYSATGVGYGIGVDFAVSNRVVVGLEYMNRKTDGDIPTTTISSDLDVNSLSLRVGLSF